MQNIAITSATREQVFAIPGIELAAATLFSEVDLPQTLRHKTTTLEDLRYALDKNRLWVAVADNGKVIGYAVADIVDDGAYLTEVDVLPAFGRLGTGTRLVNAVIEWARSADFTSLTLMTFRHLAWNAPFYAKLGFNYVDVADYGTEVAALFREECDAGIDISTRVAMRLTL